MIPKNISLIERQLLANQFKILSKIDPTEKRNEAKIEILEKGYTGRYFELFDITIEEIPFTICDETEQILNMYRRIATTMETLSDVDKENINENTIAFEGFDANNDPHYHYMRFMVEKLNLWEEYRGVLLNSHNSLCINKYRKMLTYQNHLLHNEQYNLSKSDLEHISNLLIKEEVKESAQLV
ncbi:YfbU family protein [Flavobacterium sp. K5-23]|uniref:YfbU family protein n=1 Tax=Flavobacterium sp. K5-23 TaxID=2746225 RepID=UPI00200E3A59|nr:YfbU family protein [Flavobacterium sp. K5-23]UQD57446.1 YfbU family protein [Flavobacterium sp. K5-23]